MQMQYALLPLAAMIVFIPDNKRLSGNDTIVTPIFMAAKRDLMEYWYSH